MDPITKFWFAQGVMGGFIAILLLAIVFLIKWLRTALKDKEVMLKRETSAQENVIRHLQDALKQQAAVVEHMPQLATLIRTLVDEKKKKRGTNE